MSGDWADGRHTSIAWLNRVRLSGEYSNVTVRVALQEFKLHLLPLLSDSTYFQNVVDVDLAPNQDPKFVVDLPDLPGGPDIFEVVVDHWYGSMEHEISTSNVAKVMSASDFLGVESLNSRGFKFLEEKVFNSWRSCLEVLATLDCNEVLPLGDELFDRLTKELLDNIKMENLLNLPEYADCSMFCNVTHLSTIAALLPPNMARHIYHCIADQAFGLYYRAEDMMERPVLLYTSQIRGNAGILWLIFNPVWETWLKKLPEFVPDLARRVMLLSCLSVMIVTHHENGTRRCFSFLCSLLVEMIEASELMTSGNRQDDQDDLGSVIKDTENFLSLTLSLVRSDVLQKCKFITMLSMVKRFNSWWQGSSPELTPPARLIVDRTAKVLDLCLLAHLNERSLSVAQVLSIYRHFPNGARLSHADLYNVFKSVLVMKIASFEQRAEISQMLDFEKLPDGCVQRIFQGLEVDHEPRLLKRVLEIHERDITHFERDMHMAYSDLEEWECDSLVKASRVLVNHFNVFMTASQEHEKGDAEVKAAKLALELQVRQQADELASLNEEKSRQERELQVQAAELLTMREEKLRLESEIGNQTAKLASVSEEKMKLEIVLEHQTAELIGESINNNLLRRELDAVQCEICFRQPTEADVRHLP